MKHGKKYNEAAKLVDRTVLYEPGDAIALVKKAATAKFDETVEVHIRTGCDGRHAEQQVRGAVVLPNGTGKTVKVLVFAKGDKVNEAEAAGADYVGGDELIPKIQNDGWLDFDVVVATPDMMGVVGRLGKVLGPKGLMPNPKARGKGFFYRRGSAGELQRSAGCSCQGKAQRAEGSVPQKHYSDQHHGTRREGQCDKVLIPAGRDRKFVV